MDSATITGDAIAQYSKHCPGVPAVAFCVSVVSTPQMSPPSSPPPATARRRSTAACRSHEIDAAVDGLASGAVQVLTSCDLISEGFDCPVIQAAILLRPTKSEALYIQQIGRALRPSPGKERAIILDHADNWLAHGAPSADREWSLEGQKKRKSAGGVPVRQCPKCFACHTPAAACPECKHVYVIEAAVPKQVAGELVEIDEALMRKRKKDEVRRARTLEDLQRIARERNYRPAWASIMYQARGGRL
jgi:DNA repair protein RadD